MKTIRKLNLVSKNSVPRCCYFSWVVIVDIAQLNPRTTCSRWWKEESSASSSISFSTFQYNVIACRHYRVCQIGYVSVNKEAMERYIPKPWQVCFPVMPAQNSYYLSSVILPTIYQNLVRIGWDESSYNVHWKSQIERCDRWIHSLRQKDAQSHGWMHPCSSWQPMHIWKCLDSLKDQHHPLVLQCLH